MSVSEIKNYRFLTLRKFIFPSIIFVAFVAISFSLGYQIHSLLDQNYINNWVTFCKAIEFDLTGNEDIDYLQANFENAGLRDTRIHQIGFLRKGKSGDYEYSACSNPDIVGSAFLKVLPMPSNKFVYDNIEGVDGRLLYMLYNVNDNSGRQIGYIELIISGFRPDYTILFLYFLGIAIIFIILVLFFYYHHRRLRFEFISRKMTEDAFTESVRKYNELIENANSIILHFNKDGMVTFFNEYAEKVFEYRRDEIIGKHLIGTIVPETESTGRDLRPLMHNICKYPEKFKNNVNENMTRSGSRIWINWTNKVIFDNNDQPVEILSIGNDISEQKRMEEQLNQARKLEAIGRFAGGIAHDFNNILQSIRGYGELMADDIDRESMNFVCLSNILNAEKRAAELIDQILTFSRQVDTEHTPVILHEIIDDSVKMAKGTIGEKIKINMDLQDERPILGDSTQLHQVVLNLITNAIHELRDCGGNIDITTEEIDVDNSISKHIEELMNGPHVLLKVKDNGGGIENEIMKHIFDPFFTTKKTGQGTGMGLATVYGIVQKCNGVIDVDSQLGKGALFSIYFPITSDKVIDEKSDIIEEDSLNGVGTVLIVDDEKRLTESFKIGLERLGYNVDTFNISIKALDYFIKNSNKYDVVLTDQTMPKLCGYEMAKEMLKVRKDIPIILYTGYSDQIDDAMAVDSGIRCFLKKPVSIKQVGIEIKKILG